MADRKYEFSGETKTVFGRTLHRIKAVISFGEVKAGDLGGWIENEENLSHEGNAWVYGNAKVCGNAEVYDNAWVCGDAWVYGNAKVCGDAEVYDNAWVYGDAWVCGDAEVYGNADLMWISKIGSRNDTITFARTKELKIIVATGCFEGTIDEFENKVKETHGENEHAKAYFLAIQLAKLRINLTAREDEDV